MKIIIRLVSVIFVLILLQVSSLFGQFSIDDEGIYYDSLGKPYTGTYIEKFEDGNVKSKATLISGRKHGLTIIYSGNGNINEFRMYRNNQMHGTWIIWNEKGAKTAEANYAANKKNGKWYIWDENGFKRYEMTYFDGKKIGTWYMWNEKGILTDKKEY